MMGISTIVASALLALQLFSVPAAALPAPQASAAATSATSEWWLSSIKRQGSPAFGDAGYTVFRNIKDYGAVGDGSTDDTAAINKAITDGNRCGQGCDSTTTTPALVYFPPGTYLVSEPIVQLYYTQFVGDAVTPPTLKASAGFKGMAVIDSDPYDDQGTNWWVNQNNFFRQVRNFVIDLTAMPATAGAGIHWQVAQATSLQNIVFNMRTDGGDDNAQIGIFMDNGSGGFMVDLTFNGGKYGAFFGNQQFTTRNMTFNDCKTAIFMNWNWAWTLQDVSINNCEVGIDMANGMASQTVGSVLVVDSVIQNTPIGIRTAYSTSSAETNGTLILDNVDMSANVPVAVYDAASNGTVLAGNAKIDSFVQGRTYGGAAGTAGKAVQAAQTAVAKPDSLLDQATGKVFTRSKPQYETVPASSFISVKSNGAKGDGTTDDTAAIQAIFDKATADQVVYFDHGAYLITDTVKVPKDIKITGEIWPLIMAGGDKAFKDQANPKAVFQVGQPGDVGAVEMSDLIFETAGPQPGAVMVEWNVAESSQGAAGLWDVHFRIGGSAGTEMELEQCAKNPNITNPVKEDCFGAFLLLHVTEQATAYLENTWYWVADHSLEPADKSQQIDIFNGRGVLIESTQGPVWAWGTSSEHSVLYNYQIVNASAVYLSLIQTETPYFQGNPEATSPFTVNADYHDPDFAASCTAGGSCARAWGLRVVSSSDVFVYGAGLYSFFDNYDQTCLETESCQENIVSIEGDNTGVHLFGLSTKASVNMITLDGDSVALDADNRNNFCATLAFFSTTGGGVSSGNGTGTVKPSSSVSSPTVSKTSTASGAASSSAALSETVIASSVVASGTAEPSVGAGTTASSVGSGAGTTPSSVDSGAGTAPVATGLPAATTAPVAAPSATAPAYSVVPDTPSTEVPVATVAPSTVAPVATEVPSTVVPVATEVPSTVAPAATEAPSTVAPAASQAPSVAVPAASQAPSVAVPAASGTPATEIPAATEVPATGAPAATAAPSLPTPGNESCALSTVTVNIGATVTATETVTVTAGVAAVSAAAYTAAAAPAVTPFL